MVSIEGGTVNDLRERRIEKEISIAELARRAGIDASAISKIEKGEFTPTDDTKRRIERGLDGYRSEKREPAKRHEISDPVEKVELRKIWLRDYAERGGK